MKKLFTHHPSLVNETYFSHLKFAATCGLRMIFAGVGVLIHSLFPFIFDRIGSSTILTLANTLKQRNEKINNTIPDIDH